MSSRPISCLLLALLFCLCGALPVQSVAQPAVSSSDQARGRLRIAVENWQKVCAPVIALVNQSIKLQDELARLVETRFSSQDVELPVKDKLREVNRLNGELNTLGSNILKVQSDGIIRYAPAEFAVLEAAAGLIKLRLAAQKQRACADFWFVENKDEIVIGEGERPSGSLKGINLLYGEESIRPFLNHYVNSVDQGGLSVFALYRIGRPGEKGVVRVKQHIRIDRRKATMITDPLRGNTVRYDDKLLDRHTRTIQSSLCFVGSVLRLNTPAESLYVGERWLDKLSRTRWSDRLDITIHNTTTKDDSGLEVITITTSEFKKRRPNPFFTKGLYKVWPEHSFDR